jgi:putative tryptophan/tyrosine transport system substrate-binding protein
VALAAQFNLPTMYQFRDYPVVGGLMSYGISIANGYHQVGVYAGQVPMRWSIFNSVAAR